MHIRRRCFRRSVPLQLTHNALRLTRSDCSNAYASFAIIVLECSSDETAPEVTKPSVMTLINRLLCCGDVRKRAVARFAGEVYRGVNREVVIRHVFIDGEL